MSNVISRFSPLGADGSGDVDGAGVSKLGVGVGVGATGGRLGDWEGVGMVCSIGGLDGMVTPAGGGV